MKVGLNSSDWLGVIRFCYWGTFALIAFAALNLLPGIVDTYGPYFIYSSYSIGAILLVFIAVVYTYPIMVLRDVRKSQDAKRFRFGLLSFICLSLVTG